MYATNEWFVLNGAVDKKTCNKIKKLPSSWQESAVDTQTDTTLAERKTGRKGNFKSDSTLRISDVAWATDQWLYDCIWPFMEEANYNSGWRYDIKAAESMQITRYGPGGFYNFHRDGMGDNLSAYKNPTNTFMNGRVRKLSMSIILNGNFQGGKFEFATYGREVCQITPIEASPGTIIVIPSSMEHRVTPVTKGIRYSLVTWFLGPPFV